MERQREWGRGVTKGTFSPPLHTLPHFILVQPRAEGFVFLDKTEIWLICSALPK